MEKEGNNGVMGKFFRGEPMPWWNYLMMSSMLFFYGTTLIYIILFAMYPVKDILSTSPESTVKIVNFLEMVYFIANLIIAIVATFALIFAREQFRETRSQNRQTLDTRTVEIFSHLISMWDSDVMKNSRKIVKEMANSHAEEENSMSKSQALCKELIACREDDSKSEKFSEATKVIEFMEYMGVICRKEYILSEDLYDFFGGHIKAYFNLFNLYIVTVQEDVIKKNLENTKSGMPELYKYPRAIFANFVWLGNEVGKFVPYEGN